MAVTYPLGRRAEVEVWLPAELDNEEELGPWRRIAAATVLLLTGFLFVAPPATALLVLVGWLR